MYCSRAAECKENMDALEMACNDTLLPIEIEAVRNFLSKIQDLRKDMLEALMGALREGKMLLDRLKELANEGTIDSRPDRIKDDANHGVSCICLIFPIDYLLIKSACFMFRAQIEKF